jgi:hypothetical protein
MDLHPIEAAWRRFRNGPHADLLRKSPEGAFKLSPVHPHGPAARRSDMESRCARGGAGSPISTEARCWSTPADEPATFAVGKEFTRAIERWGD